MLVKTKPAYITLEKLNVEGMMRNRYLAKSVADQKFFEFKSKLIRKARIAGIEIREVPAWYPSSKTCHRCGYVKKDLTLKDRIYKCPHCRTVIDRDLNAAMNLRDAVEYRMAS